MWAPCGNYGLGGLRCPSGLSPPIHDGPKGVRGLHDLSSTVGALMDGCRRLALVEVIDVAHQTVASWHEGSELRRIDDSRISCFNGGHGEVEESIRNSAGGL